MRQRVLSCLLVALLLVSAAHALAPNYQWALANVLVSEGGYSNHPADPGGPTNYGITIHDARKYGAEFGWIARPSAADVRAMPLWFAEKVYRQKYWGHPCVRGDDLPAGLDYSIFDYAVNAGTDRPGKVLRRILKLSDATCRIDADVLAAIGRLDAAVLIVAVSRERVGFYKTLIVRRPSRAAFRTGWLKRDESVRIKALRRRLAKTARQSELPAAYGPGKAYEDERAPDEGDEP